MLESVAQDSEVDDSVLLAMAAEPLMTSRKDRTHIRPQPESSFGAGPEGQKDARVSP